LGKPRRRFARSSTAGSDATWTAATPAGTKPPSAFESIALAIRCRRALVASHVDVPAFGRASARSINNTGRDLASKQRAGTLYDGAKSGQSPYLAMIADTGARSLPRR